MLYTQPNPQQLQYIYTPPQNKIIEPHNPPEVPSIPEESQQEQSSMASAQEGAGLEKMVGFLDDFTNYIEKNPLITNLKMIISQRDGLLKDIESIAREKEQCQLENNHLLHQVENEKYKMSVEMEAKEEANWNMQKKIEHLQRELDQTRQALHHQQSRMREQSELPSQELQRKYQSLYNEQLRDRQELADFKKYHQKVLNETIAAKDEKISELSRKLDLLDQLVDKLHKDQERLEENYSKKVRSLRSQIEESSASEQVLPLIEAQLSSLENPELMINELRSAGCQECEKLTKTLKQKDQQIESLNFYIKSQSSQRSIKEQSSAQAQHSSNVESHSSALQEQWRNQSKQLRVDTHSNVIKLEGTINRLASLIKSIEDNGEKAGLKMEEQNPALENIEISLEAIPPPPMPQKQLTVKEMLVEKVEETQSLYEQLIMFKIKPLFDRIKMYEQYMSEEQVQALQTQNFTLGSAAASSYQVLQQILETKGQNQRLELLLEEYNKKKENEKIIENKLSSLSAQVKKLTTENEALIKQNANYEQVISEKRLQGAKFDDLRLEHQRLKTEYAELNTNFEITEQMRAKLGMDFEEMSLKNAESGELIKELKNRLKFANNKIEAMTFRANPDVDEESRLMVQLQQIKVENAQLKRTLNYYYND